VADGWHAVSLIAPLATLGRADEVVLRVSQAIQLGLLNDGDQLPPEAEFARRLGVSAMTLREALAILRQQGLVETCRGRSGGTFVRRPTAPQLGALRDRLRAMTAGELRDVIDEQSAVSGAAARLAATRASTVSVRRLLALADQLADSATTGARVMADSRFHIEVAIASKSERLTALEVALQARLAELLWLPAEADEESDRGVEPLAPIPQDRVPHDCAPLDYVTAAGEHAAIAAAIEAEDGSLARLLAEEHAEANLRRLIAIRLSLPPQPLGGMNGSPSSITLEGPSVRRFRDVRKTSRESA
jgi:GntR family transcriptional regulator, transcriptional repressor for pyruvate dehydrogenase complex